MAWTASARRAKSTPGKRNSSERFSKSSMRRRTDSGTAAGRRSGWTMDTALLYSSRTQEHVNSKSASEWPSARKRSASRQDTASRSKRLRDILISQHLAQVHLDRARDRVEGEIVFILAEGIFNLVADRVQSEEREGDDEDGDRREEMERVDHAE